MSAQTSEVAMLPSRTLVALAIMLLPAPAMAQFGGMGAPSAPTTPFAVKVELIGGQVVTGLLSLSEISLNTVIGQYAIDPDKVESIRFKVEGGVREAEAEIQADVVTTTGETISGSFPQAKWAIRTELGTLTVKSYKLKTLTFTHEEVLGEVSGKISFQGKPIPGEVVFEPAGGGKAVTAVIGEDGRFKARVPAGMVQIRVESKEDQGSLLVPPSLFQVDGFRDHRIDLQLPNHGGMF